MYLAGKKSTQDFLRKKWKIIFQFSINVIIMSTFYEKEYFLICTFKVSPVLNQV